MLVAQALVLDPVHDRQALAAVDGLAGEFDEGLRVALEVVEPSAAGQHAMDGAARELGAVLQLGQHVGQLNVGLV